MTFATPLLAGIAAAIAIPSLLILYFLKLRRKDVDVSTTLLWKKAIQDLQANAPFQKLRKNILLLLQLLLLLAALFALAQPESAADATIGTRQVILIDRSASMNALDGDPDALAAGDEPETRLEAAKRRAIEFIDTLEDAGPVSFAGSESGDQAMVIAFDASAADIVQRFTSDKNLLRTAINSITPTDVPGAIGEAFRLAQAHRARRTVIDNQGGRSEGEALEVEGQVGGPPQTFHLFTDGRLPDLDQFLPRGDDGVVYHRIGAETASNLALTGLRAERAYDRPEQLTIFVGLQNASPFQRSIDVELLLDGTPAAIRPTTLPAASAEQGVTGSSEAGDTAQVQTRARPGTGGVVFEFERATGAIATVRLRTQDLNDPNADVLPTDDVGYLVIPPARQATVAVVTAGNLFLAEALSGLPLAELRTFSPGEFSALPAGERAEFDVTILDGTLPPDTPEGRPLPEGRFLLFNAVPGTQEGLIDRGEAEFARFVDWSRDHPVLRSLTLDAVRVGSMRRVELAPSSAAEVIAETNAGPGIVDLTTAEARALIIPFDVSDTTWPFDVSFVVFLAAAIDYLGADAADRLVGAGTRHIDLGAVYGDRLPPGASGVFITPPGGGNDPVDPGTDGRIVYGPVKQAGVYQIEWAGDAAPTDVRDGGRARRFFAANLLDSFESDAAASPAAEIASRVVAATTETSATEVRSYWPYLLLAVLAIMMLEWYIYNRKVYV